MRALAASLAAAAPRFLGRSTLVYGGNMLKALLGFAMSLIVARLLGPVEFGIFSVFVVVMIFAHSAVGEGLDPGVVRYYARAVHDEPMRAPGVLGTALLLRVLLGVPLGIAGWLGADWMARTWLGDVAFADAIRFGILTAIAAAFSTFALAVLQARESFLVYALLAPLVNFLRVAAVPTMIAAGFFTLRAVMGVQAACFVVGALLGCWLLRAEFRRARIDWPVFRDVVHFSKWTAFANLCFLAQAHLAVPLLGRETGPEAAGLFAAGATLLLVIDQITVAVLTVQMPAVSRIAGRQALLAYVRRALPLCLAAAASLALFALVAEPLVAFFYGEVFRPAGEIFRILLAGFLATLVSHPLYLVFYALNRPVLYAQSGMVGLAVFLAAAMMLIPAQGAVGAAWAVLAGRLAQAVVIGLMLRAVLRKGARQ